LFWQKIIQTPDICSKKKPGKKIRVLLTSAPGALFKHTKLSNYSLIMSKFLISNALITQASIKSYHLRFLTSAPEALVNISQKIMDNEARLYLERTNPLNST